jgi:hypothetical protein
MLLNQHPFIFFLGLNVEAETLGDVPLYSQVAVVWTDFFNVLQEQSCLKHLVMLGRYDLELL